MDMLTVHTLEDGRPDYDLHPCLGILVHAVFLNGKDLSYVNVHPLPLGAAYPVQRSLLDESRSSPDRMLHIEPGEPGTYKRWLQFRGGRKLYVAPFVLTAERLRSNP